MPAPLPACLQGSHRQRLRALERTTQRVLAQRRERAVERTRAALDAFEERLTNTEQATMRDYDDLDEVVADQDRTFGGRSRDFRHSSLNLEDFLQSLADEPQAPRAQARASTPESPNMRRPPSPLSFYDYGCISSKPKSLLAQMKSLTGETTRPPHRHASCGFFFPGTHCRQGLYGTHMVDPILMPPRHWEAPGAVPVRQPRDVADARPLVAQELGAGRERVSLPAVPKAVRTTVGHATRSRHMFQTLDKRREEAVIEHARFENGCYGGSWRDPMLDAGGVLPEASVAVEHQWMATPLDQMTTVQLRAIGILHAIGLCHRSSMGKLTQLFRVEDASTSSPTGVLEVDDFLRGLRRLGVLAADEEISQELAQSIVATIDPTSHARVNLPVVWDAVKAVRRLKLGAHPALLTTKNSREMHQQLKRRESRAKPVAANYGDAAPVDVVRLDYLDGLHNFGRAFQRFQIQQQQLLAHHDRLAAA